MPVTHSHCLQEMFESAQLLIKSQRWLQSSTSRKTDCNNANESSQTGDAVQSAADKNTQHT